MITSRDNVNPIATVIIKALDRNGDIVDQHDVTGRHEPAMQLLDFMMNCEALWGKQGKRIIRYVCEVSYVLAMLIFLSSIAPRVYAHGETDASPSVSLSSADFAGVPIRVIHTHRVMAPVHRFVPPEPFDGPHAPIRFVVQWPPVETRQHRLGREFFDRIDALKHQTSEEYEDHIEYSFKTKMLYGSLGLTGILLLIFASGYGHWRKYK